jgi:hypothetical protein
LYHAHVHPEQKCNVLDDAQLAALHRWTREVCETAVKLNADDKRFPDDWLFSHRWVRCTDLSRALPLTRRAGQRQEDQEDQRRPAGTPAAQARAWHVPAGYGPELSIPTALGRARDDQVRHCRRTHVRVCRGAAEALARRTRRERGAHRAPHLVWPHC